MDLKYGERGEASASLSDSSGGIVLQRIGKFEIEHPGDYPITKGR